MTSTVTAFYGNRQQADEARAALNEAGVDSSRIHLIDRGAGGPFDNSTLGGGEDQGFFENLTRMFLPDEDVALHQSRLAEGGVLLCAEVEDDQLGGAQRVLEETHGLEEHARGTSGDGQRVRSYARNTMRG